MVVLFNLSFPPLLLLDSRGEDEFADSLEVVDSSVMAVFPNRQRMGGYERLSWKVSCNFQRERHPLIRLQKARRRKIACLAAPRRHEGTPFDRVPAPTAVHVSILKMQPKSESPGS